MLTSNRSSHEPEAFMSLPAEMRKAGVRRMTQGQYRAKKSILTRYPVLFLTILNVTGVVASVILLFSHWQLAAIIFASSIIGSIALIKWIMRLSGDPE